MEKETVASLPYHILVLVMWFNGASRFLAQDGLPMWLRTALIVVASAIIVPKSVMSIKDIMWNLYYGN